MSSDEARRRQLLEARARLLAVLGGIAESAAERSLTRCPYRTRADVCTFRGECRNQRSRAGAPRTCAGGTLNPAPASAADLGAVLS